MISKKWFDKVTRCDCCGRFVTWDNSHGETIDLKDGEESYEVTLCPECKGNFDRRAMKAARKANEYYCCNGAHCGCRGVTVGQMEQWDREIDAAQEQARKAPKG